MTRFKLIVAVISSVLLLLSCSEILEPVSLFVDKQGINLESDQEEFDINIQSLTFESAKNANNSPYPRRLMQNGIGSNAKVLDEADLVTSIMPSSSESMDYLLGINDKLIYTQLNDYVTPLTKFPNQHNDVDYLLGVGDEITLLQLTETAGSLIPMLGGTKDNRKAVQSQPPENILKTSGRVGSDGNILLLGLGSIKAKNRSLNQLTTEVRNILIRNGLGPNFQLEITGFNSKKAFVSMLNTNIEFGRNLVPITNLPITLKELIISYGIQPSLQSSTIVRLTRNNIQYTIQVRKLFDKSSPRIVIQDRDRIEIEEIVVDAQLHNVFVGSKGNILIPGVGSFKAENKSLSDLQNDITRTLLKKGLVPTFQLEITDYRSRKFFLIAENLGSNVIALNSSKLSIRDAILNNMKNFAPNSKVFTLVELSRNGSKYKISLQELLNEKAPKVFIKDGDILKLKRLEYKMGEVFVLGGTGNAQILPIDPSNRETLADVLFTPKGALNNSAAKRSEVYLLRGQNPSVAYHLDAQSVSRILVAARTELRPNDIVYVANRPIISFNNTIAEILPLRILLKDIQNNNIP